LWDDFGMIWGSFCDDFLNILNDFGMFLGWFEDVFRMIIG
jgi:hypothetical protein